MVTYCRDWSDLPLDIWEIILQDLVTTDQLHSVAYAAESLATLGQVCLLSRAHSQAVAQGKWTIDLPISENFMKA